MFQDILTILQGIIAWIMAIISWILGFLENIWGLTLQNVSSSQKLLNKVRDYSISQDEIHDFNTRCLDKSTNYSNNECEGVEGDPPRGIYIYI